jgi:hypothetical protein
MINWEANLPLRMKYTRGTHTHKISVRMGGGGGLKKAMDFFSNQTLSPPFNPVSKVHHPNPKFIYSTALTKPVLVLPLPTPGTSSSEENGLEMAAAANVDEAGRRAGAVSLPAPRATTGKMFLSMTSDQKHILCWYGAAQSLGKRRTKARRKVNLARLTVRSFTERRRTDAPTNEDLRRPTPPTTTTHILHVHVPRYAVGLL